MNILKSSYHYLFWNVFGGREDLVGWLGTTLVVNITFWGLSLSLLYVDITGKPTWIMKHKVQEQQNSPLDLSKIKKAIKTALFHLVGLNLLFMPLVYKLQKWLGCPFAVDEVPSEWKILLDLILCVISAEFSFYYSHRLLHHHWFYKRIHKVHHEWTAPIGLIAVYSHPVEYLTGSAFTLLFGPLLLRCHILTQWLWFIIGTFGVVITHSGYHLPLMPSPRFHDYHHLKYNQNYGTFGWLDRLHGTDQMYKKTIECKRNRVLFSLKPMSVLIPETKVKVRKDR